MPADAQTHLCCTRERPGKQTKQTDKHADEQADKPQQTTLSKSNKPTAKPGGKPTERGRIDKQANKQIKRKLAPLRKQTNC